MGTSVIPTDRYEYADYFRATPDRVENSRDHVLLQNALADAIWARNRKGGTSNHLHIAPINGEK